MYCNYHVASVSVSHSLAIISHLCLYFSILKVAFTGNYNEYFGFTTDVDAVVYLMLVNDVIHWLFPQAISIGEDVSLTHEKVHVLGFKSVFMYVKFGYAIKYCLNKIYRMHILDHLRWTLF